MQELMRAKTYFLMYLGTKQPHYYFKAMIAYNKAKEELKQPIKEVA